MCETINFTSEIEATISSQGTQPPPIQQQVDQGLSQAGPLRQSRNEI